MSAAARTSLTLLVALSGCASTAQPVEPAAEASVEAPLDLEADPEVRMLAELALRIRANPEAAAELLQEANYTPEGFRVILVEIASDPTRSALYSQAVSSAGTP